MLKKWRSKAYTIASRLSASVGPPREDRIAESGPTAKKRILIVDRYPGICQSFALLLDTEYTVTTVATPQEAMSFLAEHNVDLVIMDTRLWLPSRLELLRFIKGRQPIAPVVFTSIALAEIQELEKSCGYEANGRILKPFDNEKVKEMVESLMSV